MVIHVCRSLILLELYFRTVESEEDVTLYPVFVGKADTVGGFVITHRRSARLEPRWILLCSPAWKNTRTYEAAIRIPKGTVLNIGKVAPSFVKESQALFHGGVDQALIPCVWPIE